MIKKRKENTFNKQEVDENFFKGQTKGKPHA